MIGLNATVRKSRYLLPHLYTPEWDGGYQGNTLMADTTQESLELHGHNLVAVAKERGSVRQWRCKICGQTADDATTYLESACE